MTTLLQSRNWWIEKDLKWILDNAIFIFWDEGDKRPYLVTKKYLGSSNCFKIDNDRYGFLLNAHFKYDSAREKYMSDKSYQIIKCFLECMTEWGAGEFINPLELPIRISNFFRIKKDILIKI